MVKALIFNSTNIVKTDSSYSTYEYNFPTSVHFDDGDQIAIQSIMLPYSWFNITSANNNNIFYYVIGSTLKNVQLPDGYYDITMINNFLQQTMIANGHYLLDTTGNYITYISLTQNLSAYANQIICMPIPQTLPVGWTNPANVFYNTITFTQATTPQVYIVANNFGSIIGFTSNYYPPSVQTTTYSANSNTMPNATPVNSLVITSNIINNKFANPTNIFYSFSPNGTSFGSNINIVSSALAWVDISAGSYQKIQLKFVDQNFNTIYMNDYNSCIQLLIRNKSER